MSSDPIRTPTDPDGHYAYGHQLLALTDRFNGADTYQEAAQIAEHVLDPADGVLARLGQFFEAAAEYAKASETDEGWELSYRFEDAFSTLSELSDELHDAGDRLRDLSPADQQSWQASVARYYATAPQPRAAPTPGEDNVSRTPTPAPSQARRTR